MDVYSNAFCFNSYLNGSVDLRTGQYNFMIRLASLYPTGPLEVVKDIALRFSMLNTQPSAHGTGWRISNTEIDTDRNTFTLLSGERYKIQSLPSVGGTLVIKDRKLKDLVVKRPTADTLHVIYKDGTVEILKRHSSSMPYRINTIQYENGESFTFQYALGEHLQCILNHKGEELVVLAYSSRWTLLTVDTLVDGGRYARIRFSYTDGLLTEATVPYDRSGTPGSAAYHFRYTTFRNGLTAIERVQSPMGGEERVSYSENTLAYGYDEYIPSAHTWEQIPAAYQPPMSRRYRYSPDHNFTGAPYAEGFEDGEDNLLKMNTDYFYWVEETCIDADNNNAVLSVTHATYNKFHLLTEESIRHNDTLIKTGIGYNLVPGKFDIQPANYNLPNTVTKSYERAGNPERKVIEHLETDDYGNELSRTEASGVRTEYSYYPIAGEPGKCPANFHGLFQRYLKQERTIPADGGVAVKATDHTYTQLSDVDGRYFVLLESTSQSGNFKLQREYKNSPVDLIQHGRLAKETDTIDGLAQVAEFNYVLDGDNLLETRRLLGREGQWLNSHRTLPLVNRRLLSTKRDGDCGLSMRFDVNGRLISETTSVGKTQQAGRTYAYHFATGQKNAHMVITDAQGNRVVTYFDGLGRKVSRVRLLESDVEKAICAWAYNALGQLFETVETDYLSDGPRTLKTTHIYNSWGNISRIARADGSVSIDDYDPQLNRRIKGVVGGERSQTYYNEHGQPACVYRLDDQGNAIKMESSTYDGLGLCTSRVDHGNQRTDHFFYDDFDRMVRILEVPADDSPARERTMEYAPGTSEDQLTAIIIDGTEIGRRTYDSLGRRTSQSRGKAAATTWGYETDWMEPITQTSPQDVKRTLSYDKELDVVRSIEMAGHPHLTFTYDPIAATLTRSASAGLVHELFYDEYGYPSRELHRVDDEVLTAEYSYSPGGRILHHDAADGQRSQYEYDLHGRFIKMTAGSLSIEQSYNTFAQPDRLTTVHGATRVDTEITYDALGRESERRFKQNGTLLQTLTSSYHPSGLLSERTMRDTTAQVVIGESYKYDAFGRLTDYSCQGRERPMDRQGRDIARQQFTFDFLDNLTKVITTFVNGSKDVCERFFTGFDPTQLTRLTCNNPVQDLTFTYDAAGNLQNGPQGQVYTFNGFNQLTQVKTGSVPISYRYDAEGRQVVAARGSEPSVSMAYVGDRLDTLAEGDKKVRFFQAEDQLALRSGGVDGPQLHANDAAGSVRGITAPGQAHVRRHYTPYGDTTISLDDGKIRTLADLQIPGFNGERWDVLAGLYHLGNGQRAYDPDLKIFLSPDPLGFDAGPNAYGYCNCDPVNHMDHSGLFPTWLKWMLSGAALALGVVALVTGVAGILAAAGAASAAGAATAATAAGVTTAQIVGVAGTALGVVGSTLGVAALGVEAVDTAMGWDRSHHIRNLGWAAFGFSMASWAASSYNAWGAVSKAYDSAKGVKSIGDIPYRSGHFPASVRAGLKTGIKVFTGRTFKNHKYKITDVSKAFGSTRAVLRGVNLMRSLNARYDAVTSESQEGSGPGPGQQQPKLMGQFVDMPQSATRFYQSFRDEAIRIRQPILAEIYTET
ncbi:hypothetical protein C4J98_0974 [Pseudomonas orientalis]|uniref:RHS repeat-associated core domain-containing protein n=1 Tax=Pseudomonas orientalis TaxID=76758 RepID=UPI000F562AC3|nr:RHS repeat-associated core domain-containing protein [Pseudomonas orientalis]AZE82403.1 hypothetical protein C4J98_0974 [Pseudomonas orientalis]